MKVVSMIISHLVSCLEFLNFSRWRYHLPEDGVQYKVECELRPKYQEPIVVIDACVVVVLL